MQQATDRSVIVAIWSAYEDGWSQKMVIDHFGVTRNTAQYIRIIRERDPSIIERVRSGELTSINQMKLAAGYAESGRHRKLTHQAVGASRISEDGREISTIVFGKGDFWRDVTEPLRRYLNGWRRRGFEFTHINPTEAGKRVALLDELIAGLQEVREDLVTRSHKSSYAAPQTRKEKENNGSV